MQNTTPPQPPEQTGFFDVMRRRTRGLGGLAVVGLIAALLLVLFVILPLVVVLGRSVWGPDGATIEPLQQTLSDARTWSLLGSTVLMAALVSITTVMLGVPLAWLLARTDIPHPTALKTALAMPYVIPPYIMAIGWITLLNPRSGVVNVWLRDALGFAAEQGPIDIYSLGGMVFVLGLAYFPLVMLQTYSALMGMDPSLEEAARTSGASPWRVLWGVTLPLVSPSIASGALLTFMVGMASFGVPYLVGGPARVEVLTTAIYGAIDVGTDEALARAVSLAALLSLVAATALALNGVLIRRGRALLGGKAGRPSLVSLGKMRKIAAGAVWAFVGFSVGIPVLTLIVTSLMGSWGLGFTLSNVSVANYLTVFGDTRTLGAMWTSLWLAAVTATVCVFIGTIASYMRQRTQLPGRRALPFLAELPYAVPGTVLAMGFILTFSQEIWFIVTDVIGVRILLFNTAWILLVAYSVKFLAFGVRTSDAALTQIDPSLEEAARTSGAGPFRVLTGIVVPLLRPALVAAWVLVFLPVVGEITMSILLFGPETRTLGVLLFDFQSYEDPPKAAVLGTLLVATILGGNLLVKRLTGGKLGF